MLGLRPAFAALALLAAFGAARAESPPEGASGVFSTAGFYAEAGTGRSVYGMNPGWRIHLGDAAGAEARGYDDGAWRETALPDGIELLPEEASGGVNYQGVVWYRKTFDMPEAWRGKRLTLHFEAVMGKCRVWVNGRQVAEHFGGYLPVIADVTDALDPEGPNVIAVRADNSDDPAYAPGKPQRDLDFCYFGGIYRDCWMIVTGDVYVTDPNAENRVAGGGVFFATHRADRGEAEVSVKSHLRNRGAADFEGTVVYALAERGGEKRTFTLEVPVTVPAGGEADVPERRLTVPQPRLWSPDRPALHDLRVTVRGKDGAVADGLRMRVGIRAFEFRGQDGFWLNGEPYPYPLIGANRHQDFATVGNALPNALHWRDAKKLREAGCRVIRNAHYPQDPAFMDACDELGLLVIVNTPGWQFWSDAPSFGASVRSDIRNMVRRDRNRPCVWMWEPILNETWYPESFAREAKTLVEEEYPYPGRMTACDASARGHEAYSVQFTHPVNGGGGVHNADRMLPEVAYYTREWGDNVDDWSSHNSPSRVSRAWGEAPMLTQARHYARPPYKYSCYDAFYRLPRQHMGGALWHAFDHQRGYHPDPFYGGIMDAFRQPKTAYWLFQAQRPAAADAEFPAGKGPMIYVANVMTPFSPNDVTVFSNCDEIRLTADGGRRTAVQYRVVPGRQPEFGEGMPAAPYVFRDFFDVMNDRALARAMRHRESFLLAEGLIGGKVVATHKVCPARRPSRLLLWLDTEGLPVRADGSDMVTVVAAVADGSGTVKRLSNASVRFTVEGDAALAAGPGGNPRRFVWGTAPILLRAGLKPGRVTVRAETVVPEGGTPLRAELTFETLPAAVPSIR